MRTYDNNPYYDHPVPSVTTLLSAINKPWLNMWYAKTERLYCSKVMFDAYQGLRHISSPEDLFQYIEARFKFDNPGYNYQAQIESRDAMGLGSWLHNAIDAYYTVWSMMEDDFGHSVSWSEKYLFFLSDYYPSENIKMLAAYFQWIKDFNVTRLKGEYVCHSPEGYSGTADELDIINGIKTVVDFKTGDPERIGPPAVPRFEHRMQLEAYRRCRESESASGRAVLYFRKGKFAGKVCFWHEDLNLSNEEDWQSFLAAKRLYEAMNKER